MYNIEKLNVDDICPYCESGVLELSPGVEHWSEDHLICPECYSDFCIDSPAQGETKHEQEINHREMKEAKRKVGIDNWCRTCDGYVIKYKETGYDKCPWCGGDI